MLPTRGLWPLVKIVDIERDDLQQLTSPSRPLEARYSRPDAKVTKGMGTRRRAWP
jgi:hypothetical protein